MNFNKNALRRFTQVNNLRWNGMNLTIYSFDKYTFLRKISRVLLITKI